MKTKSKVKKTPRHKPVDHFSEWYMSVADLKKFWNKNFVIRLIERIIEEGLDDSFKRGDVRFHSVTRTPEIYEVETLAVGDKEERLIWGGAKQQETADVYASLRTLKKQEYKYLTLGQLTRLWDMIAPESSESVIDNKLFDRIGVHFKVVRAYARTRRQKMPWFWKPKNRDNHVQRETEELLRRYCREGGLLPPYNDVDDLLLTELSVRFSRDNLRMLIREASSFHPRATELGLPKSGNPPTLARYEARAALREFLWKNFSVDE